MVTGQALRGVTMVDKKGMQMSLNSSTAKSKMEFAILMYVLGLILD